MTLRFNVLMIGASVALLWVVLASVSVAHAGAVRGHVTRSGTYVAPHYRSNPDSTTRNNYNSAGNYNPNKQRYTK